MAQCLAHLGRYDEALKLLESLQSKGSMVPFAPGIRLEIGKIHELSGDNDKAVDVFRKMAADFPDSIAAREAWYRVGIITLHDLTKAQEARDAFVKATENKKIPETWFTDAIAKVVQIDSLKSRMDRIEKLKEKPDELAHERFLLAELLTYSLNHPEQALDQYRKIIEEAPKSEFAVRSDFLMGLARLDTSGVRTDEAEKEVMRKIVEKYPDSHFSQELEVRLGMINLPPDMKLLRDAEQARLDQKGPDVYLPLYQAVVDSFPNTRSAYQARFIIAWCYEHELNDREKAFDLYKKLASESQNENNREFLSLASSKLTLALDEKKIIDESKKNIAYYQSEIEQLSSPEARTKTVEAQTASPAEDSEFAEMKKIRERNARIRSRYYSY
jgi:outer membrane protein assembly factor BamD (BamD/ComL family)